MKTVHEKIAKILNSKNEKDLVRELEKFVREHRDELPLPGEIPAFDKAMWAASEFSELSAKDTALVNKITGQLLGETAKEPAIVLSLKELVGATREAAIQTWQDMLSAMSWQQMVPAGALRGVGTQMVSLGTFQKQMDDINVQVNLGWLVDKDQMRVLLQAKDGEEMPVEGVEVRLVEMEREVVFTRRSDEDGSVVASNVHIGPGTYRLQVLSSDQSVETPWFKVGH